MSRIHRLIKMDKSKRGQGIEKILNDLFTIPNQTVTSDFSNKDAFGKHTDKIILCRENLMKGDIKYKLLLNYKNKLKGS